MKERGGWDGDLGRVGRKKSSEVGLGFGLEHGLSGEVEEDDIDDASHRLEARANETSETND